MSTKKKFKRAGYGKSTDEKGQVIVRVFRNDAKKGGHHPTKGNITRIMSISDAKVSEVFNAIESALF